MYKHSQEKPKHCTECDYVCVENDKLNRHMRIHTGERPYQCNDCSYAAADPFGLKRHRRTHTGEKPYVCDFCKTRFTQHNSLKEHTDLLHGNKPRFKCLFCPQYVSRKRDLIVHNKRFHDMEEPLMCKKCKVIFPVGYNLKKHQRNHDVKYLKCSLCSNSCGYDRRFLEHSLIHKKSKPFQCDLCDNQYRTKQLLKRHQNLHHNPANKLPTKSLEKHIAHNTPNTSKQPVTKSQILKTPKSSSISPRLRTRRCGSCPGCQAGDCRECAKCLDMVRYGGLGKLKQSCSLRICSNLYNLQGECNNGIIQKVVSQEIINQPKKEKYIYPQQEEEKQQHIQENENEEKNELPEPKIKHQDIVVEDFEIGELDTSNQTLVTEDLETGESVDLDEEKLILLLQNQAGN